MTRKMSQTLSLLALAALATLAWFVHQASPAPDSQVIRGLTLGQFGSEKGIAFLSGRRLDCVPEAQPPYTSTCTVIIDGHPLAIQAYRNPPSSLMQLGGGCTATYAGQIWPCEISSRHVQVHHFAWINNPLDLDAGQMEALQHQYFFENLAEEPILYGTVAFPFVAALAVLMGLFAGQRPFRHNKLAAITSIGVFTFIITFFFAIRLTSGFWD